MGRIEEIDKLFSVVGLSDDDLTVYLIRIETMDRLSREIHEIVRKIYSVVSGSDPEVYELETECEGALFHGDIFQLYEMICSDSRRLDVSGDTAFLSLTERIQQLIGVEIMFHLREARKGDML